MGPVGVQEMIVIFLVALVLFGPKKLPELGKTIGKAITEFRRAKSELQTTLQSHMKELEKETESIKEVTRTYTDEIYNHYDSNSNQYDSPYYDSGASGSYDYNSQPAESHPSTVGATALQGAESTASHEATGNGTVPRTITSESGNVVAAEHVPDPKGPDHAASHNPDVQPKPETAVS